MENYSLNQHIHQRFSSCAIEGPATQLILDQIGGIHCFSSGQCDDVGVLGNGGVSALTKKMANYVMKCGQAKEPIFRKVQQ